MIILISVFSQSGRIGKICFSSKRESGKIAI